MIPQQWGEKLNHLSYSERFQHVHVQERARQMPEHLLTQM